MLDTLKEKLEAAKIILADEQERMVSLNHQGSPYLSFTQGQLPDIQWSYSMKMHTLDTVPGNQ